jgi:hypothetical protein
MTKTPCDRVIRACRQLRRVVCAKSEAVAAGAELGIVGAVGARPDAAEAGRLKAAWRRQGEAVAAALAGERRRKRRVARGEGETAARHVEVSMAIGERESPRFIVRVRAGVKKIRHGIAQ